MIYSLIIKHFLTLFVQDDFMVHDDIYLYRITVICSDDINYRLFHK